MFANFARKCKNKPVPVCTSISSIYVYTKVSLPGHTFSSKYSLEHIDSVF